MQKIVSDNIVEIKRLFVQYGAQRAYLFGSATGDSFDTNSDIDFLFSFYDNMDYEVYTDNYFALMESLQTLLKREVDLVAEKTLHNPYLIQKINSQKIQLI